MPLATIKELLACDPVDAAEQIAAHWREVESAHDARRELADYLVNRLSGKRSVMYEVATREMPERSLLCLKRNVDEQGAWALGKEFIAIFRERPLPKMEGREGAMFSIYWGEVSADTYCHAYRRPVGHDRPPANRPRGKTVYERAERQRHAAGYGLDRAKELLEQGCRHNPSSGVRAVGFAPEAIAKFVFENKKRQNQAYLGKLARLTK